MTITEARQWIVYSSLGLILFYGVFFIMAPIQLFYYPLVFDQGLQLIQIVFPLFLGYLATAVVFAFQARAPIATQAPELLPILTKGPFLVSMLLSIALFASYWLSSSPASPLAQSPGSTGMSFEVFSSLFSAILGIHTAITSALVAYLFGKERDLAQPMDQRNNG